MKDLRLRGLFIVTGFALILLIYLVRLFYLQGISDKYTLLSKAKDLETVPLYPSRGIIYDRYEKIYVRNSPIYDVKFMPKEITISDTSVLEELLQMERKEIRDRIVNMNKQAYKRHHWQDLATQLDHKRFARLSEQLWQFEGIRVEPKTGREYVYPCGAQFLGFLNEIDKRELARARMTGDTIDYPYVRGDRVGKIGLEKRYEKLLRGQKGQKMIIVDAYNREMDSYDQGKNDIKPISGLDIRLGIDVELQMLGEQLMQNKRGSVVAIEPGSGQILAFVSAPTFDPALLSGSDLGKNYFALAADPELPLINRPLTAMYPPGSIFKILQALSSMSEGHINSETRFSCRGAWFRNRGKPACHGAHGACSLPVGIMQSCNSFFAEVYFNFLNNNKYSDIHEAYQRWFDIMKSYGVGQKLGVDIPDEKSGLLPDKEFYNKIYGQTGWGALTIYSNSIGQGEILMTPLQMANTAAMIANRGWYYPPHFLVAAKRGGQWIAESYAKKVVPGQPADYEVVVEAMEQVVLAGTARRARIDSIAVCGKTGTVENKKGEDHSVFMSFAPKEKPKIAIACIVENAGFGGTWAAPITSLMTEKYLTGKIKDKRKLDRILKADFREKIEDLPGEGPEAVVVDL